MSEYKVYQKNDFTKEEFETIKDMLQTENLSLEYKNALLSLLKAYCKELYCSDCQGSRRTSSKSGHCEWNQNMPVSLHFNNGPLNFSPLDCPVRKLLK